MCWLSNFGNKNALLVSVAGCLGYDVLAVAAKTLGGAASFQLLVV